MIAGRVEVFRINPSNGRVEHAAVNEKLIEAIAHISLIDDWFPLVNAERANLDAVMLSLHGRARYEGTKVQSST